MWEATATLPEQLSGALRTADDAFAGSLLSARGRGAFRAVAAFGLGTGAAACAAAAALSGIRPGRALLGRAGVRRPGLRQRDHAGLGGLVLGGHRRDADRGREGGRTGGDGGRPSGASREGRWPAWPPRRDCPGARWRPVGPAGARRSGCRPRCPCSSRWPGPACGRTARRPWTRRRRPWPDRRDALLAPGGATGRAGAPPRPHHPAGLRLRRHGRRGGPLVEGRR